MIEIYLYVSVAPMPFATLVNREWGSIGSNYIKGCVALAFQGFFIMVCVAIYAVLVNAVAVASKDYISEDEPEISEKAEEDDISGTEDMGKPATKPEAKEERPSLIARLNEKKAVVAAMDQKALDVPKKKEEVIA